MLCCPVVRETPALLPKIVASIAILWTVFQLWIVSPFPFIFNIGMINGLPARAIHLGFALTLTFLIYPISRGKKISITSKSPVEWMDEESYFFRLS